jgi:HEAT repeat protein
MTSDFDQLRTMLSSGEAADRLEAASKLAANPDWSRQLVCEFLDAIISESEEIREAAVNAIEKMGSPREQDVDAIVKMLRSGTSDQAYWSATILGRLRASSATAIEALAACVQSPTEMHVRERAAWALGEIGSAAHSALPALEAAVHEGSPRFKRLARAAIQAIRG